MTQNDFVRRFILISGGLLAAGTAPAMAQSRHLEAAGRSLAIESPCARSVTIQPDPALSGSFTVQATAAHVEELAELTFDGGNTAKLHGPEDECWNQRLPHFVSTMDIVVHVPPSVAVAIGESGSAKYVVGNVGGKLSLDFSGDAQLQAAGATDLALDISGAATIGVGTVQGRANADISGSGDVHIDRGTISDLALSMSGTGKFTISGGAVSHVSVNISGDGTVRIGATADDATLDISGSGTVQLAKVTGALTKDIDGSGTVTVGGQ